MTFSEKYLHVPIYLVGHKVQIHRMESTNVPLMLRARTAIAFCWYEKVLKATRIPNTHYTLWHPETMSAEDIQNWIREYRNALSVMTPEQVGGMYILKNATDGWNEQACTIVLMNDISPGELERAFEPSMRWLNDRPSIKTKLKSLWIREKETNGTE